MQNSGWSDDSFVLNLRTKDEPNPRVAAEREPEIVQLLRGGSMARGAARYYHERLTEIEGGQHVLVFLLLNCLNEAERTRYGYAEKPPSTLPVEDVVLLVHRHLLEQAVIGSKTAAGSPTPSSAPGDGGGESSEGEATQVVAPPPRRVIRIPQPVRLIVRSALSFVPNTEPKQIAVRRPYKE